MQPVVLPGVCDGACGAAVVRGVPAEGAGGGGAATGGGACPGGDVADRRAGAFVGDFSGTGGRGVRVYGADGAGGMAEPVSGSGGALQLMEDAVHLFRGASFPTLAWHWA